MQADGLLPPDGNGLRLLPGVTSRVVARSGQEPAGTSGYPWHAAPDGGATFPTTDGGWVYVSNSEVGSGGGGVGALRFDAAGNLKAAYTILQGTDRNCAGGATPWGSWLSCEEVGDGQVWECDPLGVQPAVARPALGVFSHEAAAVDPRDGRVYLTEDVPDGRLYRFTAAALTGAGSPDLSTGTLEAARVTLPLPGGGGPVTWEAIPDPTAAQTPTRHQAPDSTPFDGGEGIGYWNGGIYFSTKGDDRIWTYDVDSANLIVLYDAAEFDPPPLENVDNVAISQNGDVLVAEDGGEMRIVALRPDGVIRPIVQITGTFFSEVTGPAFDPSGTRLYFSSQRGNSGSSSAGITYEIRGAILV